MNKTFYSLFLFWNTVSGVVEDLRGSHLLDCSKGLNLKTKDYVEIDFA